MPSRRKVSHCHRRPTKLTKALHRLCKLPREEQRRQLQLANEKFVNDLSSATRKLRYARLKLSPSMRKKLKQHRKALHTFMNGRVSAQRRKQVLTQRGGIAPFLVPIIVAALGATGSIGAAATHAAISRA